MSVQHVELLIVGGGKAGKSLAMERAAQGVQVALVEEKYIGGTCINVACIPTKTLIATARLLYDAQRGGQRGVANTADAVVDLEALRANKNNVVGGMVAAHRKMFNDSPMEFIEGHAEFAGPKSVAVTLADGDVVALSADRMVINHGTRPARPAIPGLWEAGAWTSEDLLHLSKLPDNMTIIGGGYIGVECAQMLSDLGVKVTLVVSTAQILPREDADIAGLLAAELEAHGVEILLNVRAESATVVGDKTVLTLSDGTELATDQVLVAVGRTPNTDNCNFQATGIDLNDRGFIVVDDALRTNIDGVWAAGDAAGSPMFTHAAWNDFRAIKAQLAGAPATSPAAQVAGRLMPYSVFTTPELASIGINETQAQKQGLDVVVAKLPTANIPRAKTLGATAGLWKAVVDAKTHQVLGATLLGHESGEVIAAVQLAMVGGLTYEQIRAQAIAHPTMAEGLNLLFDTLG